MCWRDLHPLEWQLASLHQIRTVLSSALAEAETLGVIPRSPLQALRGRLPIGPAPEARPADPAQIEREIAALGPGDPRRMALYLARALGLRTGEICGVRWRDVGAGRVTVREQIVPVGGASVAREPKYGSGREISIGPRVAQALAEHRLALAERLLAHGIRLTEDLPVCAWPDGRGLRPGASRTGAGGMASGFTMCAISTPAFSWLLSLCPWSRSGWGIPDRT